MGVQVGPSMIPMQTASTIDELTKMFLIREEVEQARVRLLYLRKSRAISTILILKCKKKEARQSLFKIRTD